MMYVELKGKYPDIEKDGNIFKVSYSCTNTVPIFNEDKEIIDYDIIDFKLIATPEQNYKKSLEPIVPPTQEPSLEDKITLRLNQQEQALGILATQVAKSTLLQNGGIK